MLRKPVVLITGASGEIGHGLIERLARGRPAADHHPRPASRSSAPPAALVQQQYPGSILDEQPARAHPRRVRGRPRLPPRRAALDARRVHARRPRTRSTSRARCACSSSRRRRASRTAGRSSSSTRARSPPTACPTSTTKAARRARPRGRVERADHDVRLQQALLRAPRPLLRAPLQAARRRDAVRQGRLPLRALSRADLGGHGALGRHLGLRARDAARGGAGPAVRLLRAARHAHPVHGDARRRRGAAPPRRRADARRSRARSTTSAPFNPSAEEIRGARASRRSRAPRSRSRRDLKRQAIVDSWPADVDDTAARRDWGFAPRYDEARAFAEYLVPTIRGDRYRGTGRPPHDAVESPRPPPWRPPADAARGGWRPFVTTWRIGVRVLR